MISLALMFVFGAWNVQQLSALPSFAMLVALSVSLICSAFLISRLKAKRLIIKPFKLKNLTVLPFSVKNLTVFYRHIFAFTFGIIWASGFAMLRLSEELPKSLEQVPIEMVGVVASVPESTERGIRFRFDVETLMTPEAAAQKNFPRHISLTLYQQDSNHQNFQAGERWQLTARLKRPHGTQNPHGFDFEAWALAENIRATGTIKTKVGMQKLQNFVWRSSYIVEFCRERIGQRIAKVLVNKPYNGITQALVMGDDSQINRTDWDVMQRAGVTHLMSISGLHITMLAGLAFGLAAFIWRRSPNLVMRFPTRKAATVAGVVVALVYALLAGFSVPTQRTVYMLLVFAFALWSGRQLAIAQVLSIALIVVVLLDPWAVSAPGFWLSFGAVAILAYVFSGRIGQLHWFKAAVKTQWAVTLGMLPLLLLMFNQASIISPIANAVAIPLISFIVTPLALLGGLLGFDTTLTNAPLQLSYWVLQVCMALLNWLSSFPQAVWQQHSPATWTFFPAMIGVLWMLLPRGFPMRWLGFFGFLPMFFIVPRPPALGEMKVTILDVGQGLSVVVRTHQHTFLYDAGPKFNTQSDAGNRIVLPYLRGEGVAKLDGFVVSHNDIDHSGGMLSILSLMPTNWFASSFSPDLTLLNQSGLKPSAQHTKILNCFAGQRWVWDGVKFEVLSPSLSQYVDAEVKDNNNSCVIKVSSKFSSVLLTGDIEADAELALLRDEDLNLKADVMTVPHHGSKTSSTVDFIAAVNPKVTVFTVGYLNRFNHPRPDILARYHDIHSQVYRSDYNGALEINFTHANVYGKNIKITNTRTENKRYWHQTFDAAISN